MYGHRFINIETEEEDNMADNQFASTIGALFQGMDEFVTTKTVVGEPVTVGDAIILPLVDVTCGMAAGAFGQSAKEKNAGGMSAKMTPSAVLVIQNGMTKGEVGTSPFFRLSCHSILAGRMKSLLRGQRKRFRSSGRQ